MTVPNWFGTTSFSELRYQLYPLSGRKLHLLTAAILRRVWDDLPSDHTRIAVAATEALADGRMTAEELSRLRSVDFLESGDGLWTTPGSYDTDLIGLGCCEYCDSAPRVLEYECRVARSGYVLDGVREAVEEPEWTVIRAAARVRELLAWQAEPEERDRVERAEAEVQHRMMLDISGGGPPDADWPRWRTWDVLALARGIYRDGAFDRLPILADALQDAGCDDEAVLWHCRVKQESEHVRGCWVVDLAMGFS